MVQMFGCSSFPPLTDLIDTEINVLLVLMPGCTSPLSLMNNNSLCVIDLQATVAASAQCRLLRGIQLTNLLPSIHPQRCGRQSEVKEKSNLHVSFFVAQRDFHLSLWRLHHFAHFGCSGNPMSLTSRLTQVSAATPSRSPSSSTRPYKQVVQPEHHLSSSS
jgi:hypothetical protein